LDLFDISKRVSYAGEIDKFHEFAGGKLKWDEMRKQAEENIKLIAEVGDENFRKFGLVTSIILDYSQRVILLYKSPFLYLAILVFGITFPGFRRIYNQPLL
jgi:hypothetical protein